MAESQNAQVIGVGSPIVDMVVEVTEEMIATIPGEKGGMELVDTAAMQSLVALVGGKPVVAPGGSAGNTTFALAHMGVKTAILGKLGNDPNGDFYIEQFTKFGGDPSRFKKHPAEATAACLSMVTPDSERTMRTNLGAAATLTPDELSVEDFRGCRLVHVEGYLLFNRDLLMKVLNSAKEAGCEVSLDLGSFEVVGAARDILPDLLEEYVDIVFANEEEAEMYCGDSSPRQGLIALAEVCDVAAVKLGKKGAMLMSKESGEQVVPIIPVNTVLDTTGAGDYWAAGFLYGHLHDFPLKKCGELGAIMGGNVVQYFGSQLPATVWDRINKDILTMK